MQPQENPADQAVASVRRCLKLLAWRLGVHPAKARSSDTLTSLSLAAVVATPDLGLAWCMVSGPIERPC